MLKKFLSIITVACLGISVCSCGIFDKDDDDEPEVPENPSGNGNSGGNTDTRNDPTAYFPFNGNFNDLSGNDFYGYGAPEPGFTDGVTSGTKALSFTKTGQQKFVVGDGLIDTREMTICFWAKNISEGNIFYLTSSNKNDGGEEMMALTYRDGHLKYIVSRYCIHYQFDNTGNFTHKSIEDGEWHHIAITSDYNKTKYSEATSSLFIDGRLMDTVTEHINVFDEASSSDMHYGTGTKFIMGGNKVPSMQIAHLRVYDYCILTEKEIKNLYDSKK